jgi:hypothetical protein
MWHFNFSGQTISISLFEQKTLLIHTKNTYHQYSREDHQELPDVLPAHHDENNVSSEYIFVLAHYF